MKLQLRYPQSRLTTRQQQIVTLVLDGFSNEEIARRFDLSEDIVEAYLQASYLLIGLANRTALAIRPDGLAPTSTGGNEAGRVLH
jgi:DNA-binding NarL/FixJ family response regulator